jgi:ATP-dependent DNA helicase RecG
MEVLRLIENDTKLTQRKLARMLNINVSAAQSHLALLKEKGIIKRIDGTRGYWKILIKGKG